MKPRIRTIKPEAAKDEELWDLGMETGLPVFQAFVMLWCQCDREGRFEWRPRALKTDCLPFWDGDFSRVLDALESRGFIVRYACNGREFGLVRTFTQHQSINGKEPESQLPEPTESSIIPHWSHVDNTSKTRGEHVEDVPIPSLPFRSLPIPSLPGGVQGGAGRDDRDRKRTKRRQEREDRLRREANKTDTGTPPESEPRPRGHQSDSTRRPEDFQLESDERPPARARGSAPSEPSRAEPSQENPKPLSDFSTRCRRWVRNRGMVEPECGPIETWPEVQTIIAACARITGHADEPRHGGDPRMRAIAERAAEGATVEELVGAFEGAMRSEWHAAKRDRHGILVVLRDSAQVAKFLALRDEGPPSNHPPAVQLTAQEDRYS